MMAWLCLIGIRAHDAESIERIATAAGFAFRCRDCGRTEPTEGELLRIDDHVDVRRKTFDRNAA